MKKVFVVLLIVGMLIPWPLTAGVCRVQRLSSAVYSYSYQEPVYLRQVVSPYYYAVGQELQLDALAEKLAQRIEQKLVQRQKAPEAPQSILSAKCASCHSPGTKAVKESEAPVFFDAAGRLTATAEQRASMATASKLGVMPPQKELSDDEYLQLKSELSHVAPIVTPPPPPMPSE